MNELQTVLKTALGSSATTIEFRAGKVPILANASGSQPCPGASSVSETDIQAMVKALMPQQALQLRRGEPGVGSVRHPQIGEIWLLARPGSPAYLSLFLPPNGKLICEMAWKKLLNSQQQSKPALPSDGPGGNDPFAKPGSSSKTPSINTSPQGSDLSAAKKQPQTPVETSSANVSAQPVAAPRPAEAPAPQSLPVQKPPAAQPVADQGPTSAGEKGAVPLPASAFYAPSSSTPQGPVPLAGPSAAEIEKPPPMGKGFIPAGMSQEVSIDESYRPPDASAGFNPLPPEPPVSSPVETPAHQEEVPPVDEDGETVVVDTGSHQVPSAETLEPPPQPVPLESPDPSLVAKVAEATGIDQTTIGRVPRSTNFDVKAASQDQQHEPQTQQPRGEEYTVEGLGRGSREVDNSFIDGLLRQVVSLKGSDLHLTSNLSPMVRVDGQIQPLTTEDISSKKLESVLNNLIPDQCRAEFHDTMDVDFSYEIAGLGRFRVNLFRDLNGIGGVIRVLPLQVPTVEDLNLPPVIKNFCNLRSGLVLVTGPTGSGKTTTLAAMVDYVNRHRSEHIVTIEDPIEFVHPVKKSLVNQRSVGFHTKTFASALRAALREDPDVILIGEMRDLETTSIALETAETGHLVFGTLHTTSAISTVDRVVEQFPADRQEQVRLMLATSLRGVVTQVLVPGRQGGRFAAREILVANDGLASILREKKTHMVANHMQTHKQDGNLLMNESLLQLVVDGLVTPEQALLSSQKPSELMSLFRSRHIQVDGAA